MDKMRIVMEAKQLRGEIVNRLYDFYGEDMALSTIKNLLKYKKYYSDKDVRRAVCYLSGEDRERPAFIRIQNNADDYWSSLAQLTPTGVKLAEGDRVDEGVIISE